MTKKEYGDLLSWFDAYVGGFATKDGALSPPLELKRSHSMRVAENTREIARKLELGEAEVELAGAVGLLHDIGRFSQFSRYESFSDADTIDHGEEGPRVLEQKTAGVFELDSNRERLLFAVRYHNRKTEDIPPGPSPAHDSLLRLVRDADKIDIMEIVLRSVEDNGFRALPVMLPNIKLSRELTPGILAKAVARETLSTGSLATLGDFLLQVSAWFYDLNHAPSRRLAARKSLLVRFRRELPDTKDLGKFFEDIARVTQMPLSHRGE